MGWASRTHVFKASAKTSTLAFRSPKEQCSAPAVDNVRVDPIAICVENDVRRRRLRQRALSGRGGLSERPERARERSAPTHGAEACS